ncbi:ABC transporter permease [Nonomuraea sp. NPDC050310]|uniref:ABC transporter permease n=1 Tax=Nonomuraea sp. NPDC050310 TaxID=3154935 RepID=UPI00340BA807
MNRFTLTLTRIAVFAAILGGWELLARAGESTFYPPPSAIAAKAVEMWFSGPAGQLWLSEAALGHFPPSIGRLLAGWVLAGVIGIGLGLLLGRTAVALRFLDPVIQFGRALPPPALLMVFLALFGSGPRMQIAVIAFGIVWPVLFNTIDGARNVDALYLESARAFGLSGRQRLTKVILPAAAPKIFAGLRVSLSLALILMVISELVGATDGIGFQLLTAQRNFDLASVWGLVILLGVLGLLLNGLFLLVERRLLAWHRFARQTV